MSKKLPRKWYTGMLVQEDTIQCSISAKRLDSQGELFPPKVRAFTQYATLLRVKPSREASKMQVMMWWKASCKSPFHSRQFGVMHTKASSSWRFLYSKVTNSGAILWLTQGRRLGGAT